MHIVRPNRVSHSYVQTIEGRPDEIFPLYCPVKEALWCEGWDPLTVFSESGVNEPDCVFQTEADGVVSTWYVTVYDKDKGRVQMIKHTPEVTVSKLDIRISPLTDKTTQAEITYAFTSLGEKGDEVVRSFTRKNYEITMTAWEKAMNHYLATGEMLTGLPRF